MSKLLELAGDPNATLHRVPVVLPVALDQSYDYLLGEEGPVEPGTFVLVPFGPQVRIGVVWDEPVGPQKPVAPSKLKPLAGRVDVPNLPIASMRFAEWICKYTLSPLGMVLRMMMGARSAFEPEKIKYGVQIVPEAQLPARMTTAREKAIEIAGDGLIRAKSELARAAGCT
ncbi:MAG: primosomal protein N', partial [Pseudomonadota bacterium]